MTSKTDGRWLVFETNANARWENWDHLEESSQDCYECNLEAGEYNFTYEFSPHSCYSAQIGTVCIVRGSPSKKSMCLEGNEGFKYMGVLFPAGRNDICIILVERIEFTDGAETKENWNFEQIPIVPKSYRTEYEESKKQRIFEDKDYINLSKIAHNCASTYSWSSPTPLYFEAIMRAKHSQSKKRGINV